MAYKHRDPPGLCIKSYAVIKSNALMSRLLAHAHRSYLDQVLFHGFIILRDLLTFADEIINRGFLIYLIAQRVYAY